MPAIVSSGKDDDIFIEFVEMTENVMKHYDVARAIERTLDSKMKKEKKKSEEKITKPVLIRSFRAQLVTLFSPLK